MARRLRAFKRWMRSQGIDYSDALDFVNSADDGITVRALCDLKVGDLVATIPKLACLTVKTSGARDVIEEAGLGGSLGLSVALMYERSLGCESPWHGYLQLLPERECVPMVWSLEESDTLLMGTELHKIVEEDKTYLFEDWKECIEPLIASELLKIDPEKFSVEQYFAARSLVTSRSFEIDDYHGSGMVPLADLFNHKTGAENVHFTAVSSHSSSDVDDNGGNSDAFSDDKPSTSDLDMSSSGDDPGNMEMIIVRDVDAGTEIFNTYGLMGNAALLHRYGFTEHDNPFDIVNVDLQLVLQWSASSFSSRHNRARLSLWRRLNYSGCISQNSEYFEISSIGEPQLELLLLLYIILLTEASYDKLNCAVSSSTDDAASIILLTINSRRKSNGRKICHETVENMKEYFLTETVCSALVSIADIRESLYGSDSMEDDLRQLKRCQIKERKLYHSLVLRVRERTILENLRIFASTSIKIKKRKV